MCCLLGLHVPLVARFLDPWINKHILPILLCAIFAIIGALSHT